MTEILNLLEPWWRFGAALLVGALVGLEREYVQQRSDQINFAGIRTFSLISLLGAVAALLSERHGLPLFLTVYAGLSLLIFAGYWRSSGGELSGLGATTEVAALLVPLLGAMIVWDYATLGIALGVITALLLALKPSLQTVARQMSTADLQATLQFALIAAVILPLLPNRTYGPFDVLNPFEIWLLVVFVSGIGFLGYVLMKTLGAERGLMISGILGGIVSSTATTVSFASRSRDAVSLSGHLAQAIILASIVMLPRVVVEVLVVAPMLLRPLALPIGAMTLVGLVAVFWLWRRVEGGRPHAMETLGLVNPLELSTALTFAVLFAVVLVATKAAQTFFGTAGLYVASALAGTTGVDAITLSVAELASRGQIEFDVAAVAIILATLVNTAVKAALALALGAPELRRPVGIAFVLIAVAGLLATTPLLR